MERIIDVFADVVWYNGYEPTVEEWLQEMSKKRPKGETVPPLYTTENLNWIKMSKDEIFDFAQQQVLWMVLVNLFGDYGTSPRFGWIEHPRACANFLKEVLKNIDRDWEEE